MQTLSLCLRLEGENRKAARAWFADLDPPSESAERVRAIARDLGVPYSPTPQRYLCWEQSDERVVLPPDFWRHVGNLAVSSEDALPEFWLRWGPLWPTPNPVLRVGKIRQQLGAFLVLAVLYVGHAPLKKGMPPPIRLAEDLLWEPTLIAMAARSSRMGEDLELTVTVSEKGRLEWIPAGPADWLRVPAPPLRAQGGDLSFATREAGLRWLREEVLVPSAARLLGGSVRFIPWVTESGVALEAVCDYPFSLAVAQMVFEHADWKLCACGCGRPVPPGRKYASDACKQRVKNADPYRMVLCYLNTWRRRGKLTQEQCGRGHALAKRLRAQYDDYEALKQAVFSKLGLPAPAARARTG